MLQLTASIYTKPFILPLCESIIHSNRSAGGSEAQVCELFCSRNRIVPIGDLSSTIVRLRRDLVRAAESTFVLDGIKGSADRAVVGQVPEDSYDRVAVFPAN